MDVAEQDLAVALELVERRRRRRRSSPRRGRPASAAAGARRARRVNGVSSRSGGDRDLARRRTAGRGCAAARRAGGAASVRTWKPLQIPRTSPPSAANAGDRPHDRAEPGDHAGPEVVAVGEAARAGRPRRRRRGDACSCHSSDRLRAGDARGALSASMSRFEPGKTTTPIRTVIAGAADRRRRRRPEHLDLVRLDQRVREQLARRAARRPRAPPPRRRPSTVSSTRRPTRTRRHAVDPEMAEAALDRPALGIEDPGLRR